MSDDLRDRIADVIERSLAAWVNDIAPGCDHAAPDYAAQVIIDDLGLTVEDRNDGSESRTAPDGSIIYGVKCRVVGRWEKQ